MNSNCHVFTLLMFSGLTEDGLKQACFQITDVSGLTDEVKQSRFHIVDGCGLTDGLKQSCFHITDISG